MNEHEVLEQEIYAVAPLFYRLKTQGYFDPADCQTEEDLALRARLGLPAFVPERRYPSIHYWGLECCDGWLNLVLDASVKIEFLLHEMLAAGVAVEALPGCVQIKEKFGGLRIYWHAFDAAPVTPSMREVIAQAEERAARTCSVCGAAGIRRTGLGYSPFCDACAAGATR
jgi:hypothetical protein